MRPLHLGTFLLSATLPVLAATRAPRSAPPAPIPPSTPSAPSGSRSDSLPDGAEIVATALGAIGSDLWRDFASFESIATARSAMGDSRIEYRFVAPDARLLIQSMPGGRGVLTLGCAAGVAWRGEPGRYEAVDPAVARELSGGGDLQTLVASISERFGDFRTLGRSQADGRDAWLVAMTPRADASGPPWTLLVGVADARIIGFDVPAPPTRDASSAPSPAPQSIRLARWEPIEVSKAAPDARRPLAFREATIVAGGVRTDIAYERVAANHLRPDAIVPPEDLGRRSDAPAAPMPR